ncbi:MAG: TPM domain-containing protein [Burkholderiaceae bacterium]|nr:TPM domain-containing protein [Burkholderiaceae bacterium]
MVAGRLARTWTHLVNEARSVRRVFDDEVLTRIEAAIARSERAHTAELRIAFEASLPLREVWRGRSPRERALEVFGSLRVWDTEANNGVLLYVLWADRAVEIVADRAAAASIPPQRWREVCDALSAAYRRGEFEPGTLVAIERIHALMIEAFPATAGDANELPNRPAIL